jgi:hypothetical protein
MYKILVFFLLAQISSAQLLIGVDAEADVRPISPYLYGRNNSFSSTNPNWTLPQDELVRLRDAGVRFFRESGGNNSSKYNWRRKLSSHPDWYNNVYVNNWDQAAQTLQEQKRSGVRLLDVLDIHFYPSTQKTEEVVQLHRVFFDRNYNFPEANGVKTSTGGYDNSLTREYIFARCNDWLAQYLGENHGITLGLTETGIADNISPSVTAVWYASSLGEFMKNNVEPKLAAGIYVIRLTGDDGQSATRKIVAR